MAVGGWNSRPRPRALRSGRGSHPGARKTCCCVLIYCEGCSTCQQTLVASRDEAQRSATKETAKMDDATLSAYDRDAKAFADDWAAQPAPIDLHNVVDRFFIHGRTADIGCGSGRDAAWLGARGYPTVGFDASEGLLAEARRRHRQIEFKRAALPARDGIPEASFTNVMCETDIMNLEP